MPDEARTRPPRGLPIIIEITGALAAMAACGWICLGIGTEWGGNERDTRLEVRNIISAINMHIVKNGSLPETPPRARTERDQGNPPRPVGHPYAYLRATGLDLFEVASSGRDGIFGTADDIVGWSRTPQ